MPEDSITFVVSGTDLKAPLAVGLPSRGGAASPGVELGLGELKHSVRVEASRAGDSLRHLSATPGEDVVVLHVSNGPALVLHPAHARDLLLSQPGPGAGRGVSAEAPGPVRVPIELRWQGLEAADSEPAASRGLLGRVVLWAIEVFKGKVLDEAQDLAAEAIAERFDQSVRPGVYKLHASSLPELRDSGQAPLATLPADDEGPILCLIHGTFSTTHGTFVKLWQSHPQRVQHLFEAYGQRVYALDHETLGKSPLDNALLLLKALPPRARVHLLTHSRGGLVAEVLARVCSGVGLRPRDRTGFLGGWARELETLEALYQEQHEKQVQIERVVRVACPSRGTLLASKRLDAYLSVLKWALTLSGLPVAPELVDFAAEVARRRLDPERMPGLAAMVPNSPIVKWLHDLDGAIPGQLRVVAGDTRGDSVTTWLKTLVADSFYWTDNDLVVQTRSMYGGAARTGRSSHGASAPATFLLARAGNVSHFAYFHNERTAAAVIDGLLVDRPDGFRLIGPLSWSGESAEGVRAMRRPGVAQPDAATMPAVFVLPGILGSHIKVDDKRVWLSQRIVGGFDSLDIADSHRSAPDGVLSAYYGRLAEYLRQTHEVIEFAFDWRKPLEDEAARLAHAVHAAVVARAQTGQPVRILAHSMGGLLARVMRLLHRGVWDDMMANGGARVLFLGTPHEGSWAPMQVLSGDDTLGNTLSAIGALFDGPRVRMIMAQFPGFLQLQAGLLDGARGLHRRDTWVALAERDRDALEAASLWHRLELQLTSRAWGIPGQQVLDRACVLQRALRQQREELLVDAAKMCVVLGTSSSTPDGYEASDAEGVVYINVRNAGDGRVTDESALLSGVRAFQLPCPHGELADHPQAFAAFVELLERGDTKALPAYVALSKRGEGKAELVRERRRPANRVAFAPPEQLARLFDPPDSAPLSVGGERDPALVVGVTNGNLKFEPEALLLGHYRASLLTGSEVVIDALIGGTMKQSLALRQYPTSLGEVAVFDNITSTSPNPLERPRPEAAIVIGLGEEGKLTSSDLTRAVTRGVISWAQRVHERQGGAVQLAISATLIGSGGTGVTAGQSAQAVALGVRQANRHLSTVDWPTVSRLQLVELFLERATEAWRALSDLATANPNEYRILDHVRVGTGGLLRPLEGSYRGASYDFITAVTEDGQDGSISYTLDTKRARSEVRAKVTQRKLIQKLVETASSDRNADTQIGRTLFQLLVPLELEPFLGGTSEVVFELNHGTAGIPWELLETPASGRDGEEPWAIRSKLLRKLRTDDFRQAPVDASTDEHVLVIGEPDCDPRLYPRLPGARREGEAVRDLFREQGFESEGKLWSLLGDAQGKGADTRTIINHLLARSYRIIHVAGHGVMPPDAESLPAGACRSAPPPSAHAGGVVLSDGTFLGPSEVRSMRVVPELVFLNCCYLAARDEEELLSRPYNRVLFAATIAEELIKAGVRCVIAAGWAVDDGAALAFARAFYKALVGGRQRFSDAVATARQAARAAGGGNTWAAYQCYGDPDWTFRSPEATGGASSAPAQPLSDLYRGIASAQELVLAVDTLVADARYRGEPRLQRGSSEGRRHLRYLIDRFAGRWGSRGEVAEALADGWAALGEGAEALTWYERAVRAADGSASLRAVEQRANVVAQLAVQSARDARSALAELDHPADGFDRAPPPQLAREQAKEELSRAQRQVRRAIAQLEALCDLGALGGDASDSTPRTGTVEREGLCGTAYKRAAMIERLVDDREGGPSADEEALLAQMEKHYERASRIAMKTGDPAFFYPALQCLAAKLAVQLGKPSEGAFDPETLDLVRRGLATALQEAPDFWSAVGLIDLDLYLAMANNALAVALPTLEADYARLRVRVGDRWMWSAVAEQMRFLFLYYKVHAPESERAACDALLRVVGAFC